VVAKSIKTRSLNLNDPEMSDETKKIAREELLHEMRLLSTLRHPDLVLFLGACLDNEPFFFLIEFMEGGDLETYMQTQIMKSAMREWKPSYEVAMKWIMSVARALGFLHNCVRPVIHRDLKPLNLLLTRTLELKVTDFGLSKIMNHRKMNQVPNPSPQMSGGVGTWRYMAPEVVRYEQYTDRIDIYAFALIMYHILSGKTPFYDYCGHDSEKVLQAYIRGEEPRPTLNSSIATPELRTLMQDAWAVLPMDRPSAQRCLERLQEMPTTLSMFEKWTGRRPSKTLT